jgi:predicted RNase H-like HicB family nuclease
MNKYAINISWSDEDEGYIAICPEFPGLSAFGETEEDALCEAKIALDLMIKTYREEGMLLPEPQVVQDYSGQLRLRLAKSMHRTSAQMAEQDKTSLNQFIVDAIAEKIGARKGTDKALQEIRRALSTISAQTNLTIQSQLMDLESRQLTTIKKTATTETSIQTIYVKQEDDRKGN